MAARTHETPRRRRRRRSQSGIKRVLTLCHAIECGTDAVPASSQASAKPTTSVFQSRARLVGFPVAHTVHAVFGAHSANRTCDESTSVRMFPYRNGNSVVWKAPTSDSLELCTRLVNVREEKPRGWFVLLSNKWLLVCTVQCRWHAVEIVVVHIAVY